jgi:TPR repeat protein
MYWYQLGADNGETVGDEGVGEFYACGYGVNRDPAIAHLWMKKAADGGNESARKWLDANPAGTASCPRR